MFSKACEYGIKAIVYIATKSLQGERVKIGDVVGHIDSPEAFTGKVLGALVKQSIVESHTGPNGGFEVSKSMMRSITLSDIVQAIDGDRIYNGCALGLSACSDSKPCPMHHKYVKVRAELKEMLRSTTVYDLAMGFKSGETILMRT